MSRLRPRFRPAVQNAWVYNGSDNMWPALINQLVTGVEATYGHAEFRAHMAGVDLWQLKWKSRALRVLGLLLVAVAVLVVVELLHQACHDDAKNETYTAWCDKDETNENEGSLAGWVAPFKTAEGLVALIGTWATLSTAFLFWWRNLASLRTMLGKPKSAHFAETGMMGAVK